MYLALVVAIFLCVAAVDEKVKQQVTAENQRYKLLQQQRQQQPDRWAARQQQTFNNPTNSVATSTDALVSADSGCQCNEWSIYDSFHRTDHMQTRQRTVGDGVIQLVDDDDEDDDEGNGDDPTQQSSISVGEEDTQSSRSSNTPSNASQASMLSSSNSTSDASSLSSDISSIPSSARYSIAASTRSNVSTVSPDQMILQGTSLLSALQSVETVVLTNQFQSSQALYRQLPTAPHPVVRPVSASITPTSSSSTSAPAVSSTTSNSDTDRFLLPLLAFHCSLTEKLSGFTLTLPASITSNALASTAPASSSTSVSPYAVTCLAFCAHSPELFAAAYGPASTATATTATTSTANSTPLPGFIIVWSMKNPRCPRRYVRLMSSSADSSAVQRPPLYACSLQFSDESPHLLAAGLCDGNVIIIDIRGDAVNRDSTPSSGPQMLELHPIMASSYATGLLSLFLTFLLSCTLGGPGKHSAPVWDIRWVPSSSGSSSNTSSGASATLEDDDLSNDDLSAALKLHQPPSTQSIGIRLQQLMSVSGDGIVKRWTLKKGLQPTDIMLLKRVANPAMQLGQAQSTILSSSFTHRSSALSFDVNPRDPTLYIVATADGLLAKCSTSYFEQTMAQYVGHTGAAHRVRLSPWLPDVFASCSDGLLFCCCQSTLTHFCTLPPTHTDWSTLIWHQRSGSPLLKLSSVNTLSPIVDCAWCPANSCVLATLSLDGHVELWDLERSSIDPIISFDINASDLSPTKDSLDRKRRHARCLMWSPVSTALFVGTADGRVELYRCEGLELDKNRWSIAQQIMRLQGVIAQQQQQS